MHIVAYHHGKRPKIADSVTTRAAARQRLLRKTVWWNIGLLLVYAVPGSLACWYAPVLSRYTVLCVLVPVNNSPWEMLKLLFWPGAVTAAVRLCCTGNLQKGILMTYAEGLGFTMGTYLIGYYLITGILGSPVPLLPLFLFLVNAAALVFFLQRTANSQQWGNLPGGVMLLLLAGCFVWFTQHPPGIGLFCA